MTGDVGEVLAAARSLARVAFVQRFTHPFLLVGEPAPSTAMPTAAAGGAAADVAITLRPPSGPKKPTVEELVAKARRDVSGLFPIVKTERYPFPDRIAVGRGSTCDVVLQTQYVSKLHAWFVTDERGAWELVDARSANGTLRNGTRLQPGVRTALSSGDVLRFGFLDCDFVDAARLYDVLRTRPA